MADITTDSIASGAVRARLDRFFASLGQGFNAYVEARSRRDQIEALEALSDAELAERGLKRNDIPRYVFRDLFYR
jgi:uncharacterized protein YjiS (DUF1127 family)